MDTLIETMLNIEPGQAAFLTLFVAALTVFLIVFYGGRIAQSYLKAKNEQIKTVAQSQAVERQAQTEFNLQLLQLAQAQMDNFEAIAKQMEKNEKTNREVGKLITALTETLSIFTRTISQSLETLETTLMNHIEQNQLRHNALVTGQDYQTEGVTGVRNEISALTKQIETLVLLMNQREGVDKDFTTSFVLVANRLEQATLAVEALNKINSDNEAQTKEIVS